MDEFTIARAQQKSFFQIVQKTAETVVIDSPQSFDQKMALLRKIRPDQRNAIDALAQQFLSNWRMSLAFEIKLSESMPNLHHQLDLSRGRIIMRVAQLMLSSTTPWTELDKAGEIARESLYPEFRSAYGSIVDDIAAGEIARLIGECSIGWSVTGVGHVS